MRDWTPRCYPMSGCAHRYNLDLPETMAAREKLLPTNVNIASSRREFRAWIEARHASEDECWLRVRRGRCLTSGVCVMEWNFSARRFAIRWKAFVREGFEGLHGARIFVPLEGKAAQMSRRPSRAQKPLPAGRVSARQEDRGGGGTNARRSSRGYCRSWRPYRLCPATAWCPSVTEAGLLADLPNNRR